VPTILKREANHRWPFKTKHDLSGLVDHINRIVTTRKRPFFGGFPIARTDFQSQAEQQKRTGLIIFIRPTVLLLIGCGGRGETDS